MPETPPVDPKTLPDAGGGLPKDFYRTLAATGNLDEAMKKKEEPKTK